MNAPSTTITAAFLAGLAFSLILGVMDEVFHVTLSQNLSNLAVTFGSSAVGYFWPEKRYAQGFPQGPA